MLSDEGSAVSELVKRYDVGVFVNWNELDRMGSALGELLDSTKYAQNIRLHYPHFIDKFDRNRGMDSLYDSVKTLISEEMSVRT